MFKLTKKEKSIDDVVEVDEKEFFKRLYKVGQYYLEEYEGIKSMIDEIKFYKGIGYKIKYYLQGDTLFYKLKKPKQIGFHN